MPKIGATPFGYRIAEQFGLPVVPPRPALVPLAFAPEALARYGDLSGVSVDAEVACNGGRFRENLLFTHRGLSGPAILQISSYWDGRDAAVDRPAARRSTPTRWLVRAGQLAGAAARRCWRERLPRRFAQQWCAAHERGDADEAAGRSAAARSRRAVCTTGRCCLRARSATSKAEVTLGGVDTRELSSKTMAATDVPGLYFIGEVVDVTGWLGGYNFQWAWASGHAAGQFA